MPWVHDNVSLVKLLAGIITCHPLVQAVNSNESMEIDEAVQPLSPSTSVTEVLLSHIWSIELTRN